MLQGTFDVEKLNTLIDSSSQILTKLVLSDLSIVNAPKINAEPNSIWNNFISSSLNKCQNIEELRLTNLADKIGLAQYQALLKILSEKPPTSLKKLYLCETNFIYQRRGEESLNVLEEYIKPLLEQLECLEEL